MNVQPAADEVVERIARGADVVVDGEADSVDALLTTASALLASTATVVSAIAPPGGLSLSGLIATLSGDADFDGHDDAALERALRRVGQERTVLVLASGAGLKRSALRFLRQLARQLPELRLVVAAFGEMEALLAEPGMEVLRARLLAEPPVVVAAPPAPASHALGAVILPVAGPMAVTRARASRPVWPVLAGSMAASLALGAWFGVHWSQPTAPSVVASVTASPVALPLVPATVAAPSQAVLPVPALAGSTAQPERGAAPQPKLAGVRPPLPATASGPAMAAVAAAEMAPAEDPAPRPHPARVVAEERHRPAARPAPRVATARYEPRPVPTDRRPGAQWSDDEAFDGPMPMPMPPRRRFNPYAEAEPPPAWGGERAITAAPGSYVGSYVANPYGGRVFSYQP